jgi:hypothetical protein
MSRTSRRDFLKSTVAAALAGATGVPAAKAAKRSATDWVTLGNSGVKVTRLALGTGTFGGKVQRGLTQEEFTRVVRHAYDRGIRFFETADSYTKMPRMLAEALKGVPRDSYKLMTKYRTRDQENPKATIDRLRKDLNASTSTSCCCTACAARWPEELQKAGRVSRPGRRSSFAWGPVTDCCAPSRSQVAGWRCCASITSQDGHAATGDTKDLGDVSEVVGHARNTRRARACSA